MNETSIMHRTMLKLTEIGVRCLRNNVGSAWMGKAEMLKDGSVLIREPRRVQFGLGVGSSDLIGFTPYTVKPSDIGRELAIFTACEVKTSSGKVTPDQKRFLQAIEAAGGIAVVARDPDKAVEEVMRKTHQV